MLVFQSQPLASSSLNCQLWNPEAGRSLSRKSRKSIGVIVLHNVDLMDQYLEYGHTTGQPVYHRLQLRRIYHSKQAVA